MTDDFTQAEIVRSLQRIEDGMTGSERVSAQLTLQCRAEG